MFLLRCPQGHDIPVSTSAAGSQVKCPECGTTTDVPKLRELKQLPTASTTPAPAPAAEASLAPRLIFAFLLVVSLGTGAASVFAAFRWQSFPVPPTSADHIAGDTAEIAQLNPVEVVAVWNDYERFDVSIQEPFPYEDMRKLRLHWQKICYTTGAIALVCIGLATIIQMMGRPKNRAGHLGR